MGQLLEGMVATVVGDEDAAVAALAAPTALAALAAPLAFCASLARSRRTRMVKLETRRWSRGLSATDAAVISIRSGRVSHWLLPPRFRSSSDTRSLDCAMPVMVTVWLSCRMLVTYTPS